VLKLRWLKPVTLYLFLVLSVFASLLPSEFVQDGPIGSLLGFAHDSGWMSFLSRQSKRRGFVFLCCLRILLACEKGVPPKGELELHFVALSFRVCREAGELCCLCVLAYELWSMVACVAGKVLSTPAIIVQGF